MFASLSIAELSINMFCIIFSWAARISLKMLITKLQFAVRCGQKHSINSKPGIAEEFPHPTSRVSAHSIKAKIQLQKLLSTDFPDMCEPFFPLSLLLLFFNFHLCLFYLYQWWLTFKLLFCVFFISAPTPVLPLFLRWDFQFARQEGRSRTIRIRQ